MNNITESTIFLSFGVEEGIGKCPIFRYSYSNISFITLFQSLDNYLFQGNVDDYSRGNFVNVILLSPQNQPEDHYNIYKYYNENF